MKKLITIFLSIALLAASSTVLYSCEMEVSKKEDSEDKKEDKKEGKKEDFDIKGTWVLEIKIMDIFEAAGESPAPSSFSTDASCDILMKFDENEATISMDTESFENCVNEFIDDWMNFLKSGKVEEKVYGKSMEEHEEAAASEGMSMDEYWDSMGKKLKELMHASAGQDMFAKEGTLDYTFDGSVIEFYDEDDEKNNGFEFEVETDGDTMKIVSVITNDDSDGAKNTAAVYKGKTLKRK